ncbi:SMI1/KNR4 family protein [Streptomyces hygroscopicus]|uniref:SMI1/KNR4 family protein n=1 Tax=Streptomyces hygroscopicus TaxID=1912 RepID=UPI00068D437A|nr:SMI1/KNR4 family protein [Streptomyces hygroscopicus]
MRATFADFTVDPPRFGNGTARYRRCRPDRERLAIGAGGRVEFDFALDGEPPEQLTLTLVARVPPLGEPPGRAPVDITVNGHEVIRDFTVPGGARPREAAFAVPGEALATGVNTLCVHGSAEARGLLWLHRITVEPSRIGACARALWEERLEITRNAGAGRVQLARVRFFTSAGTAVPAAPAPVPGPPMAPRTVGQWRAYLAEYSATILRVADEEELGDVSDEQRAVGWLGYEGADEKSILALEKRLGARLPPSYRAFLGASDGWLNISPFMWRMRTAETVGWLRETDPETWSVIRGGADGSGDDTAFMDRALLVSEEGDAQHWLLDPADVSEDGEWAAYIWASWYPALGDRHASFAALVAEERTGFGDHTAHEAAAARPESAEEPAARGSAEALRGEARKAMAPCPTGTPAPRTAPARSSCSPIRRSAR